MSEVREALLKWGGIPRYQVGERVKSTFYPNDPLDPGRLPHTSRMVVTAVSWSNGMDKGYGSSEYLGWVYVTTLVETVPEDEDIVGAGYVDYYTEDELEPDTAAYDHRMMAHALGMPPALLKGKNAENLSLKESE